MRATLVFLSLVGSTVADVYQVPLAKTDSEMTEMLREGKWMPFVKQRRAREWKNADLASKDSYAQKIYADFDDTYLVANITIGTPPQLFRVVLDTNTPSTWVIDYNCSAVAPLFCDDSMCDSGLACKIFCEHQECCAIERRINNPCRGKPYFESSKSSTYVESNGYFESAFNNEEQYIVEGFWGNDTISLGGPDSKQLTITGVEFGQATTIGKGMLSRRFDGVVGLGLWEHETIFSRASALELIEPIFTVFMTQRVATANNVFGGVFTYGGLDTVNCGEVIAYENLTKGKYSWSFKVQKVISGGYSCSGSEGEGWNDVISLTAYAFIGGPPDVVSAIFKENHVTWSGEVMANVIDCNSKFSIEFVIGNNSYTVGPENLVQHVGGNVCIVPMAKHIQWGGDASWQIGYPFIRQFCHVYDMKNKRIGFAKPLKK